MPPEARIKRFSHTGTLGIDFSAQLEIPEQAIEDIRRQQAENRRHLASGRSSKDLSISVIAIKGPDESKKELLELPVIDSWELVSIGAKGVDLRLNYTHPLEVSSGEESDLLLIQMDLSEYKDASGQTLPESLVKYVPIPTQVASVAEAEKIQSQGESADSAIKSSASGNIAINLMLSGSLNMVWSMIEGLQVVNHMPLFSVKSPGNVNFFSNFFQNLSSFSFVDTNELTEQMMYFPEMDALTVNYQNAGYLNLYVIPNLGFLFYILVLHFALAAFVFVIACGAKRFPKVAGRMHALGNKYLYWNGTIRFLIEGYLDMALFSVMNIAAIDWDTSFIGVNLCNYLTVALLLVLCTLPIGVFIFFVRSSEKW